VIEHRLEALEVDNKQAREAVEALVHTVLFSRALGGVAARRVRVETFDEDVAYCACEAECVEKAVTAGADGFLRGLEVIGPDLVKGEVVVSFHVVKKRTAFLGFVAQSDEKVAWERWTIPLIVNKGSLQAVASTASLRSSLFAILRLANEVSHLPSIKSDGEMYPVYPFDLEIKSSVAQGEQGGILNEMLSRGPPLSMRFNF